MINYIIYEFKGIHIIVRTPTSHKQSINHLALNVECNKDEGCCAFVHIRTALGGLYKANITTLSQSVSVTKNCISTAPPLCCHDNCINI